MTILNGQDLYKQIFGDAPLSQDEEGTAQSPVENTDEKSPLVQQLPDFHLDMATPLTAQEFPHRPPSPDKHVPATIPNVQFLLKRYGIIARYDVIKKKPEFILPGVVTTIDNADIVALEQIKSLARMCNLSTGGLAETLITVADRNQYNPMAVWVKSKEWDGIDRLEEFYATITVRDDYSDGFKKILMYRWGISVMAAVFMPQGFRSRGVLTFQGRQALGKTSWFANLVPDLPLREKVIKLDHHMDAGDKDSRIAAATHLIVEIGELESSFSRDVARLKGFITADADKIRLPYARATSNFPRKTVFCATVNDSKFLVDKTGNSRWWIIPAVKIDYLHEHLDMQQVWAQFAVEYEKGECWWLDEEEEKLLEMINVDFKVVSVIEELLMPQLDVQRKGEEGLPAMTPTEVLKYIGFKNVTNNQARECGALLRQHLGEPKKIQGFYRWRVPFIKDNFSSVYN